MAKTKRRSFGKFLRGAVKDVVMPTSVGLGLALGGCGSSDDKPDMDGAVRADAPKEVSDDHLYRRDAALIGPDAWAILPPTDAAVDRRVDTPLYAIMPPGDAGADARDVRLDTPIYAIMPIQKDAGGDVSGPDADRDAKPDATKPQKDLGPIYAIMPLAVLPPRG